MLWGDRTLTIDGSMVFEDKVNLLKAVITFKNKKFDEYQGKFYRYIPGLQKKEPTKLSEIKDMKELICEIAGSWMTNLVIDDKEYWHIDKIEPLLPIPIPNSLPSDPRYREDMIWLRRENENYA